MAEVVVHKDREPDSASAFEPYEINGYLVERPLVTAGGGNCKWGFVQKYGKEFFIKEFFSPKYPDPDAEITETMRKMQIQECNEWFETHSRVYRAIIGNAGGNLVLPRDFFQYGNNYYLVTDKINSCDVKFEDLCKTSMEQRHMLLKVLAYEMSNLARNGVVHSDLKPNNLMLKSTIDPYITIKIIDFDASFLSSELPYPDEIVGDAVYYSPEMVRYICDEEGDITPKSDVFALGLIFHQILCGTLPHFPEGIFTSAGETVANDQLVQVSDAVPYEYRSLIAAMLVKQANERLSAQQVLQRLCQIEASGTLPRDPVPLRPPTENRSLGGGWHTLGDLR